MRTQHDHSTDNKPMISAAKEDATDSTNTTTTMSTIATHKMEDKTTEEKAKTTGPMTFKEMAKDTIESLYRKIILMEGEEIRDRGDRKIFDAYMSLRTLTDQNYISTQEANNCET